MEKRITGYIFTALITLLLFGVCYLTSAIQLYNTEKKSVHSDFQSIVEKQGFKPYIFGLCIKTSESGKSYTLPCGELLTEKQKAEFRQSKSFQ